MKSTKKSHLSDDLIESLDFYDVRGSHFFFFVKYTYLFIDYEQCTYRAYTKLTGQIKPDMEACNKQKEELYVLSSI